MGEKKKQEKLSSTFAHPQKLAPTTILFPACQHLPESNPMLLTISDTAPVLTLFQSNFSPLWLPVAAVSAFSSCLLSPRWECCSFRDVPLVPLRPGRNWSQPLSKALHSPDKRDPAALFTLHAFQSSLLSSHTFCFDKYEEEHLVVCFI